MYTVEVLPLVSCIEPIVDDSVVPRVTGVVKEFLGIEPKELTLDQVLTQLELVISTWTGVKDRESIEHMQRVSYSVYNYLQDQCCDGGESLGFSVSTVHDVSVSVA